MEKNHFSRIAALGLLALSGSTSALTRDEHYQALLSQEHQALKEGVKTEHNWIRPEESSRYYFEPVLETPTEITYDVTDMGPRRGR